jgi:diguanylate cyclase (GGDEF)-like protein
LIIPLGLGAGFALVYLPISILIRFWLQTPHEATPASDTDDDTAISREDARELLLNLHAVTSNVGREVSAHSAEMDAISHELGKGEGPTTDNVLAAMGRVIQANTALKGQLEEAKATIDEQASLIGSQLADALTDALTGIPNRRSFDHEFQRRLAEYRRERRPFCLVMCDVDRFKRLNDTYGHVAGDEVLKEIAKRVASTVRETDLAVRYGGEEFGVLLANTSVQDATTAVERIRMAVCGRPVVWEAEDLVVTVSLGVAECRNENETESSLIKRADEALYASKNAGRNCSHFHDGRVCKRIGDSADREAIAGPEVRTPNGEDSEKLQSALCDSQEESLNEPQSANESRRLLAREAFDLEVAERVMQFRRDGGDLSAILLEVEDYDRVSAVAEVSGVPIMEALAQLFTAAVGDTGIPSRYADRQYAALLCDTDIDGAIGLASRLLRAINSCEILNGPNALVSVSVSIGATAAETDDISDGLHRRLKLTQRAASNAGANCVYVHREGCLTSAEKARPCGPMVPAW